MSKAGPDGLKGDEDPQPLDPVERTLDEALEETFPASDPIASGDFR